MEKFVPVVVIKELSETDKILTALKKSGIHTAEITFRTACAAEAIADAVKNYPDMEIGAGTVINADQCRAALAAGATFIVSPGLSESVAKVCSERGVPYYPGCVTPTEIMAALELGITTVKFFPANVYGGLKALKALSAPFPQVKFIPVVVIKELAETDRILCALKNNGINCAEITFRTACAAEAIA